MMRYALGRLAGFAPTLLVIVTVAFFVIRLAPGSPFSDEQSVQPQVRANLEVAYGLDAPLPTQYFRYVAGLARGDLGPSLKQKDFSVNELIGAGLPISATLGASALLLALALGVPLGVLAALRRGRFTDHAITMAATLGIALPAFVVGPLLALALGLELRWLPVAGWERGDPTYYVLPVITLALPVAAYLARLTRGSLLESLGQPYVRAARARGLGEARVVAVHALPPALGPVVSWLGPAVAFVLTGSLVVETVFGLPGAGRFLVQGALNRDYTLVMGMIVVYGALTLVFNLIADLVLGWLDPRIRHG
jgi:oligopeptide transport system permease protein